MEHDQVCHHSLLQESNTVEPSLAKSRGHGKDKHYSKYVAIIFILNYTLGSGILALPYQLYISGWLLGTICLLWSALLTYIQFIYATNLIFRGEAITNIALKHGIKKHLILDNPNYILKKLQNFQINSNDLFNEYNNFLRNEYEINELIGIFCGEKWRIIYDLFFGLSTITTLWAYCVLFCSSMSLVFNIIPFINDGNTCDIINIDNDNTQCWHLYSFYCLLFFIWCIITTLIDLNEQSKMQIITFIFRIIISFIMIMTSIGLMYGNLEFDSKSSEYILKKKNINSMEKTIPLWNWDGLLFFISVCTLSFTGHFCVPDIIKPLKIYDIRNSLNFIFLINIIVLFFLFECVSLSIMFYFGDQTLDPCTLGWINFKGFFYNDGNDNESQALWTYIVKYCVLLLPPIDMLSCFPLNAITLSNTITQSIKKNTNIETKHLKLLIRICVVIIPIALSLFICNFGFIMILSGILNLIALFGITTYGEYKSQIMCNIITNDKSSHITPVTISKKYDNHPWQMNKFWMYCTIITVIIACIGTIGQIASI